MGRRTRTSPEGPRPVERVEFVPDGDGRGGVTMYVDGVPSSHLDEQDPTRLDFEYMRWMGDCLDTLVPPGPIRAVHLGGAACTLPRYVAATRPGSRQEVAEVDADVIAAVRTRFGLRNTAQLKLRHAEARAMVAELASRDPGSADVVIRDAFLAAEVPPPLATAEFLESVRALLGPTGTYLANIADRPPLRRAREEAATARHVLGADVALIAEPAQFKGGHRFGNVVLVAGAVLREEAAFAALQRRLASGAVRARLLGPESVVGFAAGAVPLRDPQPEDAE